jgi:hypothetical protein
MPFKRHNPGCPCCDEISSSSISSSSVSSSSISSSSSSSSAINPCDCSALDITYYLKITINHPQEYEQYQTQSTGTNCRACRIRFRTVDFVSGTGTYFIPLVRICDNPDEVKFVLDSGVLLTFISGEIQSASCVNSNITWSKVGDIDYSFQRLSDIQNQILVVTFNRPPFLSSQVKSLNIANLNLCGVGLPTMSGSITWDSQTLVLPNDPGSGFGDACANSETFQLEPLLWEIVPGVV